MSIIPYLQIRSSILVQYNHSDEPAKRQRAIQDMLYQNLREHATYTGMLTPGSKKRLTKSIENLVLATKKRRVVNHKGKEHDFQLSFIGLTISETTRNITAKEAHKQLLEPFLQWMRRQHKCNLYLWKAELQKRGQLHYHITSDAYIPFKEVQTKWNELQRKSGLLDTFYNKYGRWNAPSTHIKSVRKVGSLGGYLLKEIVKQFQNETTVGGKVWDCSLNLKASKYYTTIADTMVEQKITQAIKDKKLIPITCEHCRIFQAVNCSTTDFLSNEDLKEYNNHMNNIRDKEVVTERRKSPPKGIFIKDKPTKKDIYQYELLLNYRFLNQFSSS